MTRKNITMGVAGAAAIAAAALMMPKKDRKVKKAIKSVGKAADTISRVIG